MRWYRSFKIILGFSTAILIASYLKLDFPISAGIVTILNLLDTKKASAKVAWKRLYASAIGLVFAMIAFSLLGFHMWVFVLLVAVFVPIAFRLNAREGMAIHVVLCSHFLIYQEISLLHLWNEYTLVIIGAVIALILNLHMPNKEPKLICLQKSLEDDIRSYILTLAYDIRQMCLVEHEGVTTRLLETSAKNGKKLAYEYMNNFYLKEEKFYVEYFQMRLQQIRRLEYMETHLHQVILNKNEALIISVFTEELANVFEINNNGKKLLSAIVRLKEDLKSMDLPKIKFELEQKAFLLQYTNDLEEFIRMKVRFAETYL